MNNGIASLTPAMMPSCHGEEWSYKVISSFETINAPSVTEELDVV